MTLDPIAMLKPKRTITGMSAILLPFQENGAIDWDGFADHVERTVAAGLTPAINMDTGFGNLIDDDTKAKALKVTGAITGRKQCIAGAFVGDAAGAEFDLDAYRRAIDPILKGGETPIVFQSHGLTAQPGPEIVESYRRIGDHCGRFLGFELSRQFRPVRRYLRPRHLRGTARCEGVHRGQALLIAPRRRMAAARIAR